MSLNIKYRPNSLSDFYGNENLKNELTGFFNSEFPSTILLKGESGCGKTTLARIIAKELNGEIQELNLSNARGIDAAKSLIESLQYKSIFGKRKVIILNEIAGATREWQNCMLEVLEEPPNNTRFILCTTDPSKLLKTIKNRCVTLEVKPLNDKNMDNFLKEIIDKENFDFNIRTINQTIDKIIKLSEGVPRQALTLLNKVIKLKNEKAVRNVLNDLSISESKEMRDLCQALLYKKSWKEISLILKSIQDEAESVRYSVLGYMSIVILNQNNNSIRNRVSDIISLFSESFIYTKKAGLINACYLLSEDR